MTKAALSTDGRYFNQASKQLDSNWLLLKRGLENVPTWQEWYDWELDTRDTWTLKRHRTAEQSEGGKVVGVDPTLITAGKLRLATLGPTLALTKS